MSQRMTGRDSSPRAISNATISIFAEEKKSMASRKHAAQTAVAAAAAEVTPETIIAATAPAVEAALAEQPAKQPKPAKQAKDPAKVAKAVAALTQTPLEHAIARQTRTYDNGIIRHFVNRTMERVHAGQDRQAAIAEVLTFYAAKANEAIDAAAQADADTDAKAAEFATGK
jgi:hypothetical protein